jgi:coenzyme PQQ precursor peptide PqqA
MRPQGATKTAEAADCNHGEETIMAWTTPTLVEICIGLEINGYLPAEF